MSYVIGIDIGNSTTEGVLAKIDKGKIEYLSSIITKTTGVKGTLRNKYGIFDAIDNLLRTTKLDYSDISKICINEATPVIGDVAMETITETVITESTMIGHNPKTPGGVGLSVGYTISLSTLYEFVEKRGHNIEFNENKISITDKFIVIVDKSFDFEDVAKKINYLKENDINIQGAILQKDDAVLVHNRLNFNIPIIDEVNMIERIPLGVLCGIEVADVGKVIKELSNPYGIASIFNLTPEETEKVVPIARALIGNRSAVVIKTPKGDVSEKKIPAGSIIIEGDNKKIEIDIQMGADKIMEALNKFNTISDIRGREATNVGGMLEKVRFTMSELTKKPFSDIYIQDLLAVDTFSPVKVKGALANEFSMENAVGIASMVKSDKLQMKLIADQLEKELKINVEIGGIEANMAILGALTTPGSTVPVAVLDMGAGSTDASIKKENGEINSIHLAGAGNMVTMLINEELGLDDIHISEEIKKYPLAKVESMFHIRHEDGSVQFFDKPLDAEIFAKVVVVTPEGFIPINTEKNLDEIKKVRIDSKKRVFLTNSIRALKKISPTGEIRDVKFVILVGGSALDFEIPQLVTDALSNYSIIAGRGNIRNSQGPRNAVATGLVINLLVNNGE